MRPDAPSGADQPMHALFVHGMGRTPLSGLPLLWHLRRGGLTTGAFGYLAATERFDGIVHRLGGALRRAATRGPYIVVGHSLGGLLLRAALARLEPDVPRPRHVFLLGSPIGASRLAQRFAGNPVYRLLTGESGRILASPDRMEAYGPAGARTTAIAGVISTPRRGPFGGEPNDGVVSLSEVSAGWLTDLVHVPVLHTLLPASRRVARVILARGAGIPVPND